eukprot:m.58173 g.58173  ORF g.58173 m.58173 type:complete len:67 (+) comp11660_c0_seq1:120-320(+)
MLVDETRLPDVILPPPPFHPQKKTPSDAAYGSLLFQFVFSSWCHVLIVDSLKFVGYGFCFVSCSNV